MIGDGTGAEQDGVGLPSIDLMQLPKAELHVHLDGSLRPATMLELARERGLSLPADEEGTLADAMLVRRAKDLTEYLERFRITLSLMQDAEALERIAYELAVDHASENVNYVEVRFCPSLATEGGLTPAEVLDAVLAGLSRARSELSVETGVIVCALRSLPAEHSLDMAHLALEYREQGVCGFDLAGAEAGNPVHEHAEALRTVGRNGLPVTIHAGEAYGPESIREALEVGGARRIGHGTRLVENLELMRMVREAGVPLEICLTSNVQTGAAASYGDHPLRRFLDEGLMVCLCTDNRLMSGVTLTREYEHARDELGLSPSELENVARNGFACAFAPSEIRLGLLDAFDHRAS